MSTAIWWIRRDLRLADNQALAAALEHAQAVVPVFILDPALLASQYASPRRLGFMAEGLQRLRSDLHARGSNLIIRQGEALATLRSLREESGADNIYAEADVSPYARQRDRRVGRKLPLSLTPGVTVHAVEGLKKPDGTAYTVFTPFSRMWHSLPVAGKPLAAPEWLGPAPGVTSLPLPDVGSTASSGAFKAGESEAQRRLEQFTGSTIYDYAEGRNRMDLEGTSGLSPYLRWGMLSARQAVWAAREAAAMAGDASARQGAETWLAELAWREFYASILYHFPHVRGTAFRPGLRNIAWRDDPEGFVAWAEGHTGYPLVDAAMRQLNATGWMHNRARMVAASFLVKDLLIDWRQGERYFMQHLLDGDPAANNGGWQWTAGTGTDAAPYFRVFNPVLQGKKFDPQGNYVRRWVPGLSELPMAFIHNPWDMPAEVGLRLGWVMGINYPSPIVEHVLARQRALSAYRGVEK